MGLCQGLLIEGVAVNTFYNDSVGSLDRFAWYGRLFGVNWPWAFYLTMFHSIFSVYVPIMVTESIMPELRGKPLVELSRRNLSIIIGGTASVVILFQFSKDVYHPNPLYQLAAVLALILVGLVSIRIGRRPASPRLKLRYPSSKIAIALFPILFVTLEFFTTAIIFPPIINILIGVTTYYALYALITELDHIRECEAAVLMTAGLSINGLLVAVLDRQYHIIPSAIAFLVLTAFLYRRLRDPTSMPAPGYWRIPRE